MSVYFCGNYSGAVVENQNLIPTLNSTNKNKFSIKGFTLVSDNAMKIALSNNSEVSTFTIGGQNVINVPCVSDGVGTIINKFVPSVSGNIQLVYWYDCVL